MGTAGAAAETGFLCRDLGQHILKILVIKGPFYPANVKNIMLELNLFFIFFVSKKTALDTSAYYFAA